MVYVVFYTVMLFFLNQKLPRPLIYYQKNHAIFEMQCLQSDYFQVSENRFQNP